MKKNLYKILFLFLAVFVATVASYLNAWTGPTQTPPNGNVSAPINISASSQVKVGGLGLGSLLVSGSAGAKQYCDENGQNCASICKVADMYDSGWVDFGTNHQQTFTHNLGTTETMVYMEVKSDVNYSITNSPAAAIIANQPNNNSVSSYTYWFNKTAQTISANVGVNGIAGQRYARIMMWKNNCIRW